MKHMRLFWVEIQPFDGYGRGACIVAAETKGKAKSLVKAHLGDRNWNVTLSEEIQVPAACGILKHVEYDG